MLGNLVEEHRIALLGALLDGEGNVVQLIDRAESKGSRRLGRTLSYPIIRTLERDGFVESRDNSDPQAFAGRIFRITEKGRAFMETE